jgi:hypothetical protein
MYWLKPASQRAHPRRAPIEPLPQDREHQPREQRVAHGHLRPLVDESPRERDHEALPHVGRDLRHRCQEAM